MLNFKDKEGQQLFKLSTSKTEEFSNCFKTKLPLVKQVENWRNVLRMYCKKSFKKIRIKRKTRISVDKSIAQLIDKRNNLLEEGSEKDLKEIDNKIAELEASEIRSKIMKNFKTFSENPENVSLPKVWKLLKKISPKTNPNLPTAKRNHKGKLISGPKEIKILLAKEHKNRLRSRPTRTDVKKTKQRRQKIFKMKMKIAEGNRRADWTKKDLDRALADLKNDKSRDFEVYINKNVKADVIGTILKKSILTMFNGLRIKKLIADFLNFSNITTVPKKGSILDPKNERGIFDIYPIIDKNMSDCQMGGRKGKGCTSNIWIINGIIHEVLKSKRMKPVLLQIYDYKQMFDSIDLKEAISDIFNVGVDDDSLALIYKANSEVQMAVKTPSGLTERQKVENIVLQGDTWGSILASVQVDSIGKDVEEAMLGYRYKESLSVSLLALVDDVIGITEAGYKAAQMNEIINLKTAEKCLQFGIKKCKSMFIGKVREDFLDSEIVVDKWSTEFKENAQTCPLHFIPTGYFW